MDFDKWYRTEIESNQEDPPEALWEAIQDDLDADLVWLRLSGSLPSKKMPLWASLSMAASIALIIGLAGWFFLSGQLSLPSQLPLGKEQPALPIQEMEANAGLEPAEETIISTELYLFNESDFSSEKIQGLAIFEPDSAEDIYFATTAELLVIRPVPVNEIPGSGPAQATIDSGRSSSLEAEFLASISPERVRPSFSIGLVGQFANTWLLNQKTLRGLQSQELTTTNASFGKNLGLSAQLPISGKSGLRAELFFYSQNRQNYFEYIGGRYTATSLELDYTSISLLYNYRFGKNHAPHLLSMGVYAGALLQARQFEGEAAQKVKDQYSNTDLGLIAGYEYLFPVSDQLFLGTGIFTRFGLTNAFSGNQQIPDYLNHTRNAAFVFSLSLNYAFK
jgi:hypothetical protein